MVLVARAIYMTKYASCSEGCPQANSLLNHGIPSYNKVSQHEHMIRVGQCMMRVVRPLLIISPLTKCTKAHPSACPRLSISSSTHLPQVLRVSQILSPPQPLISLPVTQRGARGPIRQRWQEGAPRPSEKDAPALGSQGSPARFPG